MSTAHLKQVQASWYQTNKAYMNARRAAYDIKLKYEVFCHYAGMEAIWPPSEEKLPKCACCGESNFGLLTLDHVFGVKHNSYAPIRYRGGNTLYRELIRLDHPVGFRVLCFNCNHSYGHYGACPHKQPVQTSGPYWSQKIAALQKLSSICTCCGEHEPVFLSIDHIAGGGKKYRKSGGHIERDIVSGTADLSKLRVLCMNCNCGRGCGECPHEVRDWAAEIVRIANVPGKGQPVGERQGVTVLTALQVATIRDIRRVTGASGAIIAKQFGVSDVTIYKILNRQAWKEATQ